jgi:hypothetical protein
MLRHRSGVQAQLVRHAWPEPHAPIGGSPRLITDLSIPPAAQMRRGAYRCQTHAGQDVRRFRSSTRSRAGRRRRSRRAQAVSRMRSTAAAIASNRAFYTIAISCRRSTIRRPAPFLVARPENPTEAIWPQPARQAGVSRPGKCDGPAACLTNIDGRTYMRRIARSDRQHVLSTDPAGRGVSRNDERGPTIL